MASQSDADRRGDYLPRYEPTSQPAPTALAIGKAEDLCRGTAPPACGLHEDHRLHMAIGWELDDRGISDPAEIGAALGMPAAEEVSLLVQHHWREGDVALLEAAAARLGCGANAA